MISSLLLTLREGLEAALIIGIVLGVLRKSGRSDLNRPLWAGVFSSLVLSIGAVLVLRIVGEELEGTTEQIFEGVTLLLASGVLTWMIFWMGRQSRSMKARLENDVNQISSRSGAWALYLLALIAVLREGIELALFLTAAAMTSGGVQTIMGASIGLCLAAVLGYLIYTSALRLDLQRFFQITGIFLILFAAGLVAHSMAEFNEAGILPAIINPIWNLNPLLNDQSLVGSIFKTLFGYNGNPSLTEVLGYSGYILITFWFFVKARRFQTA